MKKIAIVLALLISLYANNTIKVGSKVFPESRLLGEMISILIEQNTSLKVERNLWMGGTKICFEALNSGALDVYCEYTGTAWNVVLKKKNRASADVVYKTLKKQFADTYDLHWMPPLGFNNTYVIVVNKEWSINTVSELVTVQDKIKLALNHEFMHREDGFYAMCKFYGLDLPNVTTMEHSLAYKAISEKTVDCTSAFSTDGKLVKYNLKALRDDKNFFPPYFAAPLVYGKTLRKYPELEPLFNTLAGRLNDEKMTKLNYRVEIKKEDFYDVAYEFLKVEGLIKEDSVKKERESQMTKLTRQHLLLVGISTILAILIGVPLGIFIGKYRSFAPLVLGTTGVMQTIPSLAILAIMVPIFGIGVVPSIIALTLYALLPIIRNAYTGIISVDPELIEAARAMGMTNMQILTMLEIPLSTTIVMAGVRTATVICVGTATLAAFIGGGGLGEFILTGINLNDNYLILCGTIPAAALAIFVDFLLSRVEKWIEPQGLKIQRELSN
ncbi:glycine betaine ABC transporter substrate-binding protein [Candidatus Uabimicrobium amorphum]|uniref:ABC transporter permease n=1 Tax=Uabimicrobium amorphum TaxID=2596890 RepID=A0A5S9IP58_UABAM|nr:glycine betaine ABC transporter substrate-binding protein [Candidatus Uabimicrobium amorphum]BBM84620.1 ABC transporter permease [Candidatus Uabimicrobium amorphum]